MADQMLAIDAWPPLAENARDAREKGLCTLCGLPYLRGDRIATLPCGSVVHVSCCHKLENIAQRERQRQRRRVS